VAARARQRDVLSCALLLPIDRYKRPPPITLQPTIQIGPCS
jgi:hypothetical protein